jgi:lariat debranching enzyme
MLRFKKHFRQEVVEGKLGSPEFTGLLQELTPKFWLSAHLHVHYEANILVEGKETHFLALDKPLPRRTYLDIFEITPETKNLISIKSQERSGGTPDQGERQIPTVKLSADWVKVLKAT